jgi:hypothetical protein
MPVNEWREKINIRQYTNRDEPLVLDRDEAFEEFERIKNGVCDELRKTSHYRTPEQLDELRKLRHKENDRSKERGEALVVADLIESIQKAGTVREFDDAMYYVYLWGDDRRVWFGL